MITRIYLVSDDTGADGALVEATSSAQALRYIAEGVYDVKVASPKEIAQLMKKGAIVADATKEKGNGE